MLEHEWSKRDLDFKNKYSKEVFKRSICIKGNEMKNTKCIFIEFFNTGCKNTLLLSHLD